MQQTAHKIYCFGDFTLDLTTNALLHKGQEVKLRPKAFDALCYLVENPGRLVSKEELVKAVWTDSFVTDDSLVKCLKDVRRALEDDSQQFVKTVPRRGYIFVAKVSEQGHTDANVVYTEQLEAIRVVIKEGQRDADVQEKVPAAVADSVAALSPSGRQRLKISRKTLLATALLLVLATGLIYRWIVRKPPQPPPVAMVKSMAVLPFQPLGEQNRNEVLEVGLADSLITKLSKIKQLTVRPLSAVLKYAGGEQDAVTIGRALQVEAVLESRFQQVGDRLKINSQLVRVEDGTIIWSYDCTDLCVDILTLQESVSARLARDLKFNLTSEEQKLLTKRYTDNAEVYKLYLNGRAEYPKGAREATEKAIDYFQQALAREPNYAPAYSGLADCYIRLVVLFGSPPRSVCPKAEYSAKRAIELDDTLAEAHASLATVLLTYKWDFVGAKHELERAIELDPKYAPARKRYADYLTAIGHHEEAIREGRLACDLEPTPGRLNILGRQLFLARQYDEAIEAADQARELGVPLDGQGYRFNALVELHRYEEAVEFALQQEASVGTPQDRIDELRVAFQTGGIRGFWKKEIEQLTKAPRQENDVVRDLAYDYAFLGDKDKAFAYLEKMFDERDGYLIWLQVDPRYDSLRSDPRYADLVRRIGFPQE